MSETSLPKVEAGAAVPRTGPFPFGRWLLPAGALGCLLFPVSPGLALLAGLVLALSVGNVAGEAAPKLASTLLKLSVVGLGAGMNLGVVCRVGLQDAGYTVISIGGTLALGLWLGRRARLQRDVSLLVATGTAICGGSAIAAVAGVIKPKTQEITVAMTTVFLLNAVALFLFPVLGHAMGFGQRQFGLWAALAIHDTSSVVGAAMTYGREALNVATTVKLTRALWIVPVSLGVAWSRRAAGGRISLRRLPVPLFIIGFIAAAALFTYCPPLFPWREPVSAGAKKLFAVTLFLIGAGFSREALRVVGLRPVAVGLGLWFVVGTSTAAALAAGWIH